MFRMPKGLVLPLPLGISTLWLGDGCQSFKGMVSNQLKSISLSSGVVITCLSTPGVLRPRLIFDPLETSFPAGDENPLTDVLISGVDRCPLNLMPAIQVGYVFGNQLIPCCSKLRSSFRWEPPVPSQPSFELGIALSVRLYGQPLGERPVFPLPFGWRLSLPGTSFTH